MLEHLHGRVVTVAPYAHLLRSPEAVTMLVGAVVARLTAGCAAHVDPSAAANAIEPALHRNRAAVNDLPEYLTGRQADLWRFLEGLTPGNQVLNAPFELTRSGQAAAALTRCEFDRVRQWRFVEEQRAALAADKSALDDQRQRATDAEQAGRATVHELVLERERADAAERSQKLAERWLGVIQNSASWRLTAPLRTIMRAFRRAHAAVFRSA